VIGDEIPHQASYTTEDIFWKDQLQILAARGIVVYGVQALHNNHATPFYSEISSQTKGFHLHLKDFSLITEMFVAVCFRASSQEKFEEYKKQVKNEGGLNSQVEQMFKEMDKPTEKKTFDLREEWWDRQFDRGNPKYMWDPSTRQWCPYDLNRYQKIRQSAQYQRTFAEELSAEEKKKRDEKKQQLASLETPMPSDFICPLTHEPFREPVITKDGHTYEKSSISKWLETHNTSPLTGAPLADKSLIPNLALRNAVIDWCEKHNFKLE
jgi:hypothetical protein